MRISDWSSDLCSSDLKLRGFIAALPLVTFLALVWLYVEKQPQDKIANHAWYTFWYVVPTLPMFLAFPVLLPRLGFWLTMVASIGITVICFGVFAFEFGRASCRGKSVSVRVDMGGRGIIKKKKNNRSL